MKSYIVRLHGTPLKYFSSKEEANKWLIDFVTVQTEQVMALEYLDLAVEKSDMREAKEVLKHIMEIK